MKRFLPIMLAIVTCVMFTACGGESDADKAYKSWASNTVPKMDAAETTYAEKAAQIQPTDVEDAITITEEYLAVLKPGVEELAAIDLSKISKDADRDNIKAQLEALQAKVAQVEQALELYKGQLGGASDGGGEEVYDEEVYDEEVYDEEVYDEEVYDEEVIDEEE